MILSQESEVVNFSCCDEACQGNMKRKGKRERREKAEERKWEQERLGEKESRNK